MRIVMAIHVAELPILSRCSSNTQGMIMQPSYVYILASQRNGTLYNGVIFMKKFAND